MKKGELVSASLDGELSDEELTYLMKNLEQEDLVTLSECALVSDLIRSSELAYFNNRGLVDKIGKLIESEPTVVAPTLRRQNDSSNKSRSADLARWVKPSLVASFAATLLSAVAIFQTLPLHDAQVSLVRSDQPQQVDPEQLAIWQEYFQAHQQQALRGGLSGVSPIVRSNVTQPAVASVYSSQPLQEATVDEWMNVWRQTDSHDGAQIRFVSGTR